MKFLLFWSLLLLCFCDAETVALQSNLEASDAMDSVLELLINLKEVNLHQQESHNELNAKDTEFGKELIERLREVAETIEQSFLGE